MKGLILKDLYMAKSHLRFFILLIFFFFLLATFSSENTFFLFYPAILAGTVPFSLLAYDEQSKWNQYCATLPVSRKTIVSARYVTACIFFFPVLLLIALLQPFSPSFHAESYVLNLSLLIVIGLLTPTVLLPLTFRFGVEKARMTMIFLIAAVCGSAGAASALVEKGIRLGSGLVPLIIAAAVGTVISVRVSMAMWEKRKA